MQNRQPPGVPPAPRLPWPSIPPGACGSAARRQAVPRAPWSPGAMLAARVLPPPAELPAVDWLAKQWRAPQQVLPDSPQQPPVPTGSPQTPPRFRGTLSRVTSRTPPAAVKAEPLTRNHPRPRHGGPAPPPTARRPPPTTLHRRGNPNPEGRRVRSQRDRHRAHNPRPDQRPVARP
jgi:hypothetical protein